MLTGRAKAYNNSCPA